MNKSKNTHNLAMMYRLFIAILAIPFLELIHVGFMNKWNTDNVWSFIAIIPHLLAILLFYQFSKRYDRFTDNKPFNILESLKKLVKNKVSFALGILTVALIAGVNMAVLMSKAEDFQVLASYSSVSEILNTLISACIYTIANVYMFIGIYNITKSYIKPFWVVLVYAIAQTLIGAMNFEEDPIALNLLYFVAYLNIGYSVVNHRKDFALGFYFAFNTLPSRLVCNCLKIVAGVFSFSGVAEMGYTPAFLYCFTLLAMGVVALYQGKRAYLVSMNRAELVDRGYMMVTDKHGVETPMLRATYQYSVMQAIKPWIALTEADKKRRRGRVIMQPLQKGWSFYEVFNAQGECLTHGFIDANMDLERMPESYLQDNRPKLAIAWELDTDALYYLRVEFEGETLYGALRMYSYEADHKRMAHDVSNRLYNTSPLRNPVLLIWCSFCYFCLVFRVF
jgi:hypothetical protein